MDAEKMMMKKRIDNPCERLEKVERERDALLSDLSKARNCCRFCKHDAVYTSVCDECKHGSNFEWLGLCKENGGAEDEQG